MYKIKDYKFDSFKLDADMHKSNYAVLKDDRSLGIKYNPHLDFEDEFSILNELYHKQIPKVYDYGNDTLYKDDKIVLRQHFIVLDHTSDIDLVGYFKGKTSEDLQGQLENIIKCFISVCDPLDYLHSKNYLHCDIKPGHLMLRPETCTVYLIDYELAIKKAGILKGISRDYASPEQLSLLKDLRNPPAGVPVEAIAFFLSLNDQSDIYSLGAVMYEILTNKKWKDTKLPPREVNKSIPQELDGVIMSTLEEEPSNRIATAKQLKQFLEDFI